jgi:hypothetical protein
MMALAKEKLPTEFSKRYVPWLSLLICLFTIRVVAQPLSLFFQFKLLPSFESWHGGVLPYPILIVAQGLIIVWMCRVVKQFNNGSALASHRLGVYVLIFASIYFTLMLVRLILGLTLLVENRWFASMLPALFHMVLATFLLLYGHFHFRIGKHLN